MDSSSIKTLVVSCTHGRGWGAEEVLEHVLHHGNRVMVAAPASSRFEKICADRGLPFLELKKTKDSFAQNCKAALTLRLPTEITHIHAWCTRSLETAWILSMLNRLPFTVGLHDSPIQAYHGRMRAKLIFSVCKRARGVATVSEAMANQCKSIGLYSDPVVIKNGIPDLPVSEKLFTRRSKPVIGFLGLNAPRKGFSTLVDWIKQTDFHWNLYGEVAEGSKMLLEAILTSHSDTVFFKGRKPSSEIYPEIDIVVMPATEFEPFGLVAVEAGRAALPVVTSAAGGPEEIICHEKTGYIYPINQPQVGLAYVKNLYENTALRTQLGKAGRERYTSEFKAEGMGQKWAAFFDQHTQAST